MTATQAQMRVTMRCNCGARERIFVTRSLPASWMDKRYVCDDCDPKLDFRDDLTDFERLQQEPMMGALAEAM